MTATQNTDIHHLVSFTHICNVLSQGVQDTTTALPRLTASKVVVELSQDGSLLSFNSMRNFPSPQITDNVKHQEQGLSYHRPIDLRSSGIRLEEHSNIPKDLRGINNHGIPEQDETLRLVESIPDVSNRKPLSITTKAPFMPAERLHYEAQYSTTGRLTDRQINARMNYVFKSDSAPRFPPAHRKRQIPKNEMQQTARFQFWKLTRLRECVVDNLITEEQFLRKCQEYRHLYDGILDINYEIFTSFNQI